MRSGLTAILLSVCSPLALVIGAPFYGIWWLMTKELREELEPPILSKDGWPPSPTNDTRVFHPQKKR